jgi:hypothetical protein
MNISLVSGSRVSGHDLHCGVTPGSDRSIELSEASVTVEGANVSVSLQHRQGDASDSSTLNLTLFERGGNLGFPEHAQNFWTVGCEPPQPLSL